MSFDRDIVYSKDPKLVAARINIGNLPTDFVNEKDVKERLSKYGKLLGLAIYKGHGVVQFELESDARRAIEGENGATWKEMQLDVRFASEGGRRRPGTGSSDRDRGSRGRDRDRDSRDSRDRDSRDFRGGSSRHSRDRDHGHRDSGKRPYQDNESSSGPNRKFGFLGGDKRSFSMRSGPSGSGSGGSGPPPFDVPPGARNLSGSNNMSTATVPPVGGPGMGGGKGPFGMGDRPFLDRSRQDPTGMNRSTPASGPITTPQNMFAGPFGKSMPIGDDFFRRGSSELENLNKSDGYTNSAESGHGAEHYGVPADNAVAAGVKIEAGRPATEEASAVVSRPESRYDCVLIVSQKLLKNYAEMVEQRLIDLKMRVDMIFLVHEGALQKAISDMAKQHVPYVIVIQPQHEPHRSVTVNLLHGTPQEHRNMPLDDAISMMARNFEQLRTAPGWNNGAGTKMETGGIADAVGKFNSQHDPGSVNFLYQMLIDGKPLSGVELDRLIKDLQERRQKVIRDGLPLMRNDVLAGANMGRLPNNGGAGGLPGLAPADIQKPAFPG